MADLTAPELKPCPFCGGKAVATVSRYGGMLVKCKTVGCPASPITNGKQMVDSSIAPSAWNKRTPAPDVAELVAALREVIAEVDAGQAALRNPVIYRARAAIAALTVRAQPKEGT